MYQTLPKAVERADFFRYLVILRHGGMYADSDVECMMPIEEWKDVRGLLSFSFCCSRVVVALWLSGSPSIELCCRASTGTSPFGLLRSRGTRGGSR